VAPVVLGEHLSERDLLLGLMLPSANNLALTGARWIDGSVEVFVARLNARAAALGMAHTHFADPAGLDPRTTSTVVDLLLLGEAAVANDALVSVVSTATATLPDGTVVQNLDELLGGEPGWIGIKTGWTESASGCLLFAARRTLAPGAPALTVVGAVLGQPPDAAADAGHPELGGAFTVARLSVETAFAGYATAPVGPSWIPASGRVSAPWGASTGLHMTGVDRTVLLRLGQKVSLSTRLDPVPAGSRQGTDAGLVTASVEGRVIGTWTLVTDAGMDGPSPWWKLLHG
jgi:D-alanyl-D-alanine carboxypeptidase (penicillin-binding protein 5/6)